MRRVSGVDIVLALLIAVSAASRPPPAEAQPLGTSFTYQGRLTDGGSPATGTYDVRLVVFDAASSGAQVGPIVTREDVVVTNGLFTVAIDFGAIFGGSKRWLEIGVRPGASTGAYTSLAPRQELSPSPNAVFSASAPWAGVSGKPAGFADDADNDALGGLSCANGQIAKWNGTAWACAADGGTSWGLTGNVGTNPVTNFIGTTDVQPFEVRVANKRALRIEAGDPSPNVILGAEGNFVTQGVAGAVVGGGGQSFGAPLPNRVTDDFGTVAGGLNNVAGDSSGTPEGASYATVGGGLVNSATSMAATVAGGYSNAANGTWAAIGGGSVNTAAGSLAVIGGGSMNKAAGANSSVPGGYSNAAGGFYSLAAGFRAVVRDPAQSGDVDGDEGTFTWADYSNTAFVPFTSTGPNQFLILATGGVGINTNAPSPGALTIGPPAKLTFGSSTRQMVDLWGTAYGIGVQTSTTYFRSDFGFAWFMKGTHSDAEHEPGAGGTRQMRLDTVGNLFVRGAFSPGGADFAEMLPAEDGLEPGDVLAIGSDGQLILSTTPYQESLAGVYSTNPGLVGGAADGESTAGKVPLAVAGVVPVKVTGEGGSILPGDSLTSSSTPGHAMKATKGRVGPAGVVIGKALEPLRSDRGVIRALVVLQ